MLSDKQILKLLNDADEGQEPSEYGVAVIRATEAAATAPLLARIAEQAMQLVSSQAQAQENHERAERLEAALQAQNAALERANDSAERFERLWYLLGDEKEKVEAALAEASKDAGRLDYIQDQGSTIDLLPGVHSVYPMRFRVGGLHRAVSENVRSALDSAMKGQP